MNLMAFDFTVFQVAFDTPSSLCKHLTHSDYRNLLKGNSETEDNKVLHIRNMIYQYGVNYSFHGFKFFQGEIIFEKHLPGNAPYGQAFIPAILPTLEWKVHEPIYMRHIPYSSQTKSHDLHLGVCKHILPQSLQDSALSPSGFIILPP